MIARVLPRAAIFVTAIAELVDGDVLFGSFCLIALALTLVPAIRARSLDARIPVELELALLWLMVMDMTLGNSFGLYTKLSWFDKALHFTSSTLIGMIGFLAIYVLHLTHRTRFHWWIDGIAILLVTLGIGALWEIAEYGVDQLFARRTQGSPGLSAIDDTMFDLILDAIGGGVGGVLGPLYIRHSRRSRARSEQFAKILAQRERIGSWASPFDHL